MILLKHQISFFVFRSPNFTFLFDARFRVFCLCCPVSTTYYCRTAQKISPRFYRRLVFFTFVVSQKNHLFFAFYLVLLRCWVPIPLANRLHGPYQRELNGNGRTPQHSHTFCLVHACQSQCGVRKLVSGTMGAIRVIITTAEQYLQRIAIV